jgi:acetylornithine/succinyldiaminopimelate/putrescine aminotransferase
VPYSSTPASTVCEPIPSRRHALAETCEQLIQQQLPNFFRLYLNPFVVQTCFCLSRYVQKTWFSDCAEEPRFQTFLANSFDEALSGAIKLARYQLNLQRRPPVGLVIDRGGRLGYLASVVIKGDQRIDFIPKLRLVGPYSRGLDVIVESGEQFGFVVLLDPPGRLQDPDEEALQRLIREQSPLVIVGVDRHGLAMWRRSALTSGRPSVHPDIAVFDESFVERAVPFAAFTARKHLYDLWNQPRQAAFHSTTYQPNTISSMHFLKCLRETDSEFYATVEAKLERIRRDPIRCTSFLAELYSPYLARAIATLGFDTFEARAAEHYVVADERRIFDSVAGVACSLRGHNPSGYVAETESLNDVPDCAQAVAEKLKELTGLEHMLPAVSGATAVENALRIALVAQFPKRFVVAFKGGFGGKTLLALTGTANASYKSHLNPLYEHVIYIDPFAPDALEDLEKTLQSYPVAVVQIELIQAVGGVRALPRHAIQYLEEHRRRWGYLIFVDEVQTGMYRTGPFVLSKQLGITPDILTIGKAASDMMFPFAGTVYTSAVQKRLDEVEPELTRAIRQQYDYDFGYRTVLNALRWAEDKGIAEHVAEAGTLFARLLMDGLAANMLVRDIRVHGLLIGIELDARRWPLRWFKKRIAFMYVLGLLQDQSFPLLAGFCQYEPNVLKLTPPLSITTTEVRQICATITAVLNRSPWKLLRSALTALTKTWFRRRWHWATKRA